MADDALIDRLLPVPAATPAELERRYPPRDLPPGAEVTRFAPSPTGHLHLGGLYVALIARSVASDSGGVFIVRIEDTDRARAVPGAVEQIERALGYLGIAADEGRAGGDYGPYRQSERGALYDAYVARLLRAGAAYPCFATPQELTALAERQRAAGLPTGYWGEWATWRDRPDSEVEERLAAGAPYVIRFRSPTPAGGERVACADRIRGVLELESNRNDAVIRKAAGLPTYHFAHVVDEHLMRVTTVIRGDEWISSVPVHLQLHAALGLEPPAYAHVAPLMKQDGRSRRKLSKRRDLEASADFYRERGYPPAAVAAYLRGLANSRLIDRPVAATAGEPIRLEEAPTSGQLVDLPKLDQIARDWVATQEPARLAEQLAGWAAEHDPELHAAIEAQPERVVGAFALERSNPERVRKDVGAWSDFRPSSGFLLDALFEPVSEAADERFAPLDPTAVREVAAHVRDHYEHRDDRDEWFGQVRAAAQACGFAASAGEYKREPDRYRGSIREASNVIRVLLTASRRSPDLFEVARVLGADDVVARLGAVA